jgi:hypothetical protein
MHVGLQIPTGLPMKNMPDWVLTSYSSQSQCFVGTYCSMMLRHVAPVRTDVSEKRMISMTRVTRKGASQER